MTRMLHDFGQLLRHRDIRIVLGASVLSLAGDAMAMVALLLRVHDAGHGPYAVTWLLWCFALPLVLTMGVAGEVADRVDSRRLLVVSGLVQAVAAVGLALSHDLATTYALVVLLQLGFAFGNPVWSALLPELAESAAETPRAHGVVVEPTAVEATTGEARVGPTGAARAGESVGRLVSLQHGLRAAAGPAGAGLGGVLVQLHGAGLPLLLDAVTFLALVAAAVAIRARRGGPAGRGEPARGRQPNPGDEEHGAPAGGSRPVARGLLPGGAVAALRRHPVLATLVAALIPFVITLESVNVVEVFLVRDVLGASPAQYGLTEVVAGTAALVGALVSGGVLAPATRVRLILAALATCALAQIGQGLAPTLALYLVGGAAIGLALGASNAVLFAYLLDTIEDADRGKVLALVSGASRTATVLALALGGTLATHLGPRTAYVVVGLGGLVVAAAATIAVARVSRASGRREPRPPAGPRADSPGSEARRRQWARSHP